MSRLSPYITHGLLDLREAFDQVCARHPLSLRDKLVFEWGWRAHGRHVWEHLGDGIHRSLRPGVLPDPVYQTQLPPDVLQAQSGVPVIDQAVRELYQTGYLHNHARMWLASYLVHWRKVHWHTGAQWMFAHLLDGDLASNHLGWQWVAGTVTGKPYLFNAENVAKFAPAHWHSPGTEIDASHEALERQARHPVAFCAGLPALGEPSFPPGCGSAPQNPLWLRPDPACAAGRDVWLLHPWSMGTRPPGIDNGALLIGVGLAECHAHFLWSERRWRFVTEGLSGNASVLWWGSAEQVARALQGARSVGWQDEPHAAIGWDRLPDLLGSLPNPPRVTVHRSRGLFKPVPVYCQSFSKWWAQTGIEP